MKNDINNYEKVDYTFQRLITSIAIASIYEPYKDSQKEFKEVLNIIIKWNINYDKTKDLSVIKLDEFKSVDKILYELDGKYLDSEGLYAEEAYEWILQLEILIQQFLKEKNVEEI